MLRSIFTRLRDGGRNSGRAGRSECDRRGHDWVWQTKVPASIDGPTVLDSNGRAQEHRFVAPFRSGFAWSCARRNCEQWGSVSQMRSSEVVPKKYQPKPIYGSYPAFKAGFDPTYARDHSDADDPTEAGTKRGRTLRAIDKWLHVIRTGDLPQEATSRVVIEPAPSVGLGAPNPYEKIITTSLEESIELAAIELLELLDGRLESFHVNGDLEAERCPLGPSLCEGRHWDSAGEADRWAEVSLVGSRTEVGLDEERARIARREESLRGALIDFGEMRGFPVDRLLSIVLATVSIRTGRNPTFEEVFHVLDHSPHAAWLDPDSVTDFMVEDANSAMSIGVHSDLIAQREAYVDHLLKLGVLDEVLDELEPDERG